jgi:hypothetical protein
MVDKPLPRHLRMAIERLEADPARAWDCAQSAAFRIVSPQPGLLVTEGCWKATPNTARTWHMAQQELWQIAGSAAEIYEQDLVPAIRPDRAYRWQNLARSADLQASALADRRQIIHSHIRMLLRRSRRLVLTHTAAPLLTHLHSSEFSAAPRTLCARRPR